MHAIKKTFITVSFLILSTVQAQTIFTGPGTDWDNVANWDTGNIPSASDDVLIASGQTAIMTNKGTQATPYQVASIFGNSGSQLELHQSVIEVSGIVSGDIAATLAMFESSMTNLGFNIDPATANKSLGGMVFFPLGGFRLNPSQLVVNGNAQLDATSITFVLGGTQAAAAGETGIGFYGNISVLDISLGSTLNIETKYGFQVSAGDTFKIIDINGSRTGFFLDFAEGDTVINLNGIDLTISYFGGDGNDVVLSAVGNAPVIIPAINKFNLVLLTLLLLCVGGIFIAKINYSTRYSKL